MTAATARWDDDGDVVAPVRWLRVASEHGPGYDRPADTPEHGGDTDDRGAVEALERVAVLHDAIDDAAALDLAGVPVEALPELTRELARAARRLESLRTGAVGELQHRRAYEADGHRSAKDWLRGELRQDGRQATTQARLARLLRDRPRLADAFASGELSGGHAAITARETRQADPEVRDQVEADLLEAARTMSPGQLARHVRERRIRERPADARQAESDAYARRSARYIEQEHGGATFVQELTPGDYEIHRAARRAYTTKDPKDLPEEQRRSYVQKLYDADLELARRALTADDTPTRNGAPATGTVIVDADTLAATDDTPGTEPAQLGFAGPVHPETARRLLCDANVSRLLTGPASTVLDVGRTSRTATAAQARALHGIWHGCARCGAPPGFTEIHHIIFWDDHGPTDLDNLLPLCWACHSAVHQSGLRIVRHDDQSVTFTAANGTRHHRAPPRARGPGSRSRPRPARPPT